MRDWSLGDAGASQHPRTWYRARYKEAPAQDVRRGSMEDEGCGEEEVGEG